MPFEKTVLHSAVLRANRKRICSQRPHLQCTRSSTSVWKCNDNCWIWSRATATITETTTSTPFGLFLRQFQDHLRRLQRPTGPKLRLTLAHDTRSQNQFPTKVERMQNNRWHALLGLNTSKKTNSYSDQDTHTLFSCQFMRAMLMALWVLNVHREGATFEQLTKNYSEEHAYTEWYAAQRSRDTESEENAQAKHI